MNKQDLFDALTVRFSDNMSRGDALRWVGKLVLALIVFQTFPKRAFAQDVETESSLVKGCKLPGQKCSGANKCCSNKCDKNHRCGCVNKGKSPLVKSPLGPVPVKALCCTNKLNKRTGECR